MLKPDNETAVDYRSRLLDWRDAPHSLGEGHRKPFGCLRRAIRRRKSDPTTPKVTSKCKQRAIEAARQATPVVPANSWRHRDRERDTGGLGYVK